MTHFKNLLKIDLKAERDKNQGKANVKSPREHQVKANQAMTKHFLTNGKKNGILVLPTGGGKTYTAVYWLLKNVVANNKKVLWLADQSFLLDQARDTFKENILEIDAKKREIINIRVVSGSDKHANPNSIELSDDILLMTAQTAISNWDAGDKYKFEQFIAHHGANDDLFIVYDEAHHTPALGRRNLLIGGSLGKGILETYPNTSLLGLTATPTYTDVNQRGWLWEIFKEGIIFKVETKELEDKKILANPIFIQQKTNFKAVLTDKDIEKVVFKHLEIPSHIIDELAKSEDRNDFIAQYFCDNINKFGKTIIFLDRWYQCRMIENYINKKAGKTIAASMFSYIDTNKDRDYINNRTANQNEINLERFKNDELQVLINVKMLTEGVDVPDVKTVFLTRDTNSTILFTQMVGRALRGEKAGGKKDTANVVLFSDNWDRHVSFASSQAVGGKADGVATKERGYRPYELISVDILDNLQLEYENQNYDTTILDLVPIGWYVVSYTDTIIEEVEANDFQPTIESFKENVTILEQEESLFQNFIANFENNTIWEHEELDRENAAILMKTFLDDNGYTNDKVIVRKLIQIARHLGQNGFEPHFFTFEQREVLNLMPTVLEIRNKNYGRDDTEAYLEHKYGSSGNSFLKVAFPSYEDYYKAYEHEDNVYRKHKKGNVQIAEASQEIKVKRFAPNEVRKIVFARDEYQCVCCGKKDRLEIDHIIAFKEIEPTDDNPELYQTLCGICNKFKGVNAYNYRITKYDKNQMSLDIVPDDSTKWIKFAPFYFTRLINCYYKTDAVIKSSIIIKDDNRAIWVAKLKYGTNGESPNPDENIMQIKNEIIEMISNNRYRLSDIRIEMD